MGPDGYDLTRSPVRDVVKRSAPAAAGHPRGSVLRLRSMQGVRVSRGGRVPGALIAAALCSVLLAPAATAGSVAPTPQNKIDILVTWAPLVWKPGECQVVRFSWFSMAPILEATLSTRDSSGRPVNLSSSSYPTTADLSLGIGIGQAREGFKEIPVCGPATSAEARATTLLVIRDQYISQGGGQASASSPLYDVVELPAPSTPTGVVAQVADRGGVVRWAAPVSNTKYLSGYKVVDVGTGVEICTVPASVTSCSLAALGDGPHAFIVQSLNSDNLGTVSAPTPTVTVGPPQAPAPPTVKRVSGGVRVAWSTATGSSAVPARFVVTGSSGKPVCTVLAKATVLAKGSASCVKAAVPDGGRLTVTVETALGSATSAVSAPLKK